MKVLHLPSDTGGNAWGLSRGERHLGIHSDVMVDGVSKFAYPSDYHLQHPSNKVFRYLKKIGYFFKIRNFYDIFHFNAGRSLLHIHSIACMAQFELPFYPKKAKLFVTYNGCDARQKYPTMKRNSIAACHEKNCYGGVCNSGQRDVSRSKNIQKMSQYVNHIWAVNPDLLYFLPKEKSSFLPYTVANFDVSLPIPSFEGKLKILHAPSERAAKGSKYILSALDKLQNTYPKEVELILVENRSHEEALKLYRQADLIIDQILIGWYGAFAVEVMLMGKPVIVRIEEKDLHFVPKKMAKELLETVIQADPSTIFSQLERCVLDRQYLREKALASIEYARTWHDPTYVASLTKAKYEDSNVHE